MELQVALGEERKRCLKSAESDVLADEVRGLGHIRIAADPHLAGAEQSPGENRYTHNRVAPCLRCQE
ncbi:MAG: Uncharacterised protein [Gammaproteobacteria bacterium]|nr:MAG: Uncharacterised protein [Gammaproteobacteria bacterium]